MAVSNTATAFDWITEQVTLFRQNIIWYFQILQNKEYLRVLGEGMQSGSLPSI